MQKNKNILIDASKCHQMLDGSIVMLEGRTVNHYQMYTRLSVGLSLLPAVEMLDSF